MGFTFLCVAAPTVDRPQWDRLFEVAAGQEGLFTTHQAAEVGYSPQLLVHHVRAGRLLRVRRGVYRLTHFPAGEHEELVATWLWSEQAGVLSHQTALSLLGLSDVLPAQIYITLPREWRTRRLRVPAGVILHYADLPERDRAWFGAVPVTTPQRALNDCARAGLSPDLLRHAAQQALRRGLVKRAALGHVEEALEPFGGLTA